MQLVWKYAKEEKKKHNKNIERIFVSRQIFALLKFGKLFNRRLV